VISETLLDFDKALFSVCIEPVIIYMRNAPHKALDSLKCLSILLLLSSMLWYMIVSGALWKN